MSHEVAWGDTKVYVAGHNGLVGSAIVRALEAAGAGEIASHEALALVSVLQPLRVCRSHFLLASAVVVVICYLVS